MNEKKISVKLHKSHKIVCFIVCFVIVFGITSVVAFADTFILPSGSILGYDNYYADEPTHEYYFPGPLLSFDNRLEYPVDATVVVNGENSYDVSLVYLESVYDSNGYLAEAKFGFVYDFFGDMQDIVAVSNTYENALFVSSQSFTFDVELTINSPFTYDSILDDFLRNNIPPFDYISPPPQYEGNPFLDIVNYVFEALDVRIFGYFSILDVLKVFLAMSVFVWLLKVLAGG